MGDNVYEGLGCIILSIFIARYWYKWRKNPNKKVSILADDLRLFIGTSGFFISGILLIIGYKGHKKPSELDREKILTSTSIQDVSSQIDNSFNYERQISNGSCTLKVITYCINDSINIEGRNVFQPKIINQKLIFLNNGTVLSQLSPSVDSISTTTLHGKKVKILESTIGEIGVIKGKKGIVFSIYGGGQGSQNELYGLYTLGGKLLAYSYTGTTKTFGKFGDFNKTTEQYGIADSVFLGLRYNTVSVDPPFDTIYYNSINKAAGRDTTKLHRPHS